MKAGWGLHHILLDLLLGFSAFIFTSSFVFDTWDASFHASIVVSFCAIQKFSFFSFFNLPLRRISHLQVSNMKSMILPFRRTLYHYKNKFSVITRKYGRNLVGDRGGHVPHPLFCTRGTNYVLSPPHLLTLIHRFLIGLYCMLHDWGDNWAKNDEIRIFLCPPALFETKLRPCPCQEAHFTKYDDLSQWRIWAHS